MAGGRKPEKSFTKKEKSGIGAKTYPFMK